MLTEQAVANSWRNLLGSRPITKEVLDKAEALLEELRPESPLRHRLGQELDELRSLRSGPPKKRQRAVSKT